MAMRRSSSRSAKRLWDVKQEETEVMWLLAEKLEDKGFPNCSTTTPRNSRTRRPARRPTTALEFSEIAAKMTSAPIWAAKEPLKGEPRSRAGPTSARRACSAAPRYTLKKGWGGKFATATKKFEFYSETAEEGPARAREEVSRPRRTTFSPSAATWRAASWPSYRITSRPSGTARVQDYPFTFIDYKSRLNREGRSAEPALVPGIQEGRPGRCRRGTTWSR